jgi:hypothetical protein
MEYKVFALVATLGLVLIVGVVTTIFSQEAFARHAGNGGTCITPNCNVNGNIVTGAPGTNGMNGAPGANNGIAGTG